MRWVDDYIAGPAGWQAGKIEIIQNNTKNTFRLYIYLFIYVLIYLFIYWYNVCACTLTKIIIKTKKN